MLVFLENARAQLTRAFDGLDQRDSEYDPYRAACWSDGCQQASNNHNRKDRCQKTEAYVVRKRILAPSVGHDRGPQLKLGEQHDRCGQGQSQSKLPDHGRRAALRQYNEHGRLRKRMDHVAAEGEEQMASEHPDP